MQRQATESQILEDYLGDREEQQSSQLLMKKGYLKQNILDLYTNEEERIDEFLQFFLAFLKRTKGIDTQDHDLNLLSLEELKELVRQFHSLCPPSSQTDIARAVVNTMDTTELRLGALEVKEEQFDAQKVYYANGSWDYELVGYEECKQVKEYFAVEEYRNNLAIFEKQEVKKTGGFFGIGGKYELWIEIRSNLFKENITRKVQDFVSLKNALSRSFPYVFIYPLEFTEKQLQKVNEEPIRAILVNECRKFINYVCKSQLLLQNINTHRFFKDPNHQSYANFQKTQTKEPINKIKLIQNTDGCVPLQISDKNQLLKKDFVKKGEGMEQIWTKWEQSNNRISGKLKQIQVDIEKQRKDMEKTLLEYTNVNPLLKCNIYENMISTMIGYSEIFKNYEENVGNFQFLFDSVNLQVASQSKKIWAYFNKYAKEISVLDQDYHMRRKVFLEKEAKLVQAREKPTQGKTNQGNVEKQMDPVNKSIIDRLGISSVNSFKETAWIQRFSKWQGYINKQFTNSFEKLLENDVDILQKILRQNLENRMEMHRKQQQLIKSLQHIR